MTRKLLSPVLVGLLMCQTPLGAGGFLETLDITGLRASPLAGHVVAKLVPIRWDPRTIPVQYRVNDSLDPIPNPLGPAFLSLADATAVLQASFDAWNNIKTSYIQMDIVGTVANPDVVGFDMTNELTFDTTPSFGAIASSPSVSLIEDTRLVDGEDIDGDSDADVSNTIRAAADVDSDGDIEFPAGFYRAGTILDNDVQFNTKSTNGFRFTIDPLAADTLAQSVDLMAVAVHEFGHSLGLSHVLDNQISATDGTGSTMFPFIDTGDPASELEQRTLSSDDIAWASYHYPEGTHFVGPGALQTGDVAFYKVYGIIAGEVHHGVLDQPISGASLFALDEHDRFVAGGFSGTTQLSFEPASGGTFFVDPAFNIVDGKYRIPVPRGDYAVGVEAPDGLPVPAANISLSAVLGSFSGQLNFSEEFYNSREAAIEARPGRAKNVRVTAGKLKTGIDIVTTKNVNINNFGNRNFVGFTGIPGGAIYAVRVPASQITTIAATLGDRVGFHSIGFDTFVADASVVPVFAEAMLATGSVTGTTAAVNLSEPLDAVGGFIGQDNDFAPFFFKNGRRLGRQVLRGIAHGSITDLFLVLRIPEGPFPGVSGQPPLIGLDGGVTTNDVPIFGLSYVSTDGGLTFNQTPNFNFRFSLAISELD